MKHSLFRLRTVSLSIIAFGLFSNPVLAQGNGGGKGGGKDRGSEDPLAAVNVGYRIHWGFGPAETEGSIAASNNALQTDANGIPTTAYIVGYYYRIDRELATAYAYIMTNPGNPDDATANRFWDIEELVGPTPAGIPWTTAETPISAFQSNFRNVNADGLITGYVMDPEGARRGVYLDLSEETPELRLIPEPPSPYDRYEGDDVTSTGDILVEYRTPVDADGNVYYEAYVFRPSTGEIFAILDPTTHQPIRFANYRYSVHLASFGQVVGQRASDDMAIRYSLDTGQITELPDVLFDAGNTGINDFGQVSAEALVSSKPNGKGRTEYRAARLGADNSIEWSSSVSTFAIGTINDQGDVLYHPTNNSVNYYSESEQLELFIGDLIIAESDPNGWYTGNSNYRHYLTNADHTRFGWVTPALNDSGGIAILIPEILP